MMTFLFWAAQQVAAPVSAGLLAHVYEIAALALLLAIQSLWTKRMGGRAIDAKFADLRQAIGVVGQNAESGFARAHDELLGLGHRIDLWAEKTTGLSKSVDGLLTREQTRLEDDAKATRRRRR